MDRFQTAAFDRWIESGNHHTEEVMLVCGACEARFESEVEVEYGGIVSMPCCPVCQGEEVGVE